MPFRYRDVQERRVAACFPQRCALVLEVRPTWHSKDTRIFRIRQLLATPPNLLPYNPLLCHTIFTHALSSAYTEETPADDNDILPPLRACDATTQDVLYAYRRVSCVPAPPCAPVAKTKSKSNTRVKTAPGPAKMRVPATTTSATTANAQVFDSSWSTTAMVTVSAPPATSSILELVQNQQQKPLRRGSFSCLFWISSLINQRRKDIKGEADGNRAKGPQEQRKQRWWPALLDTNSNNLGDDGNEDGNPNEAGGLDLDADADGNTADDAWPGEFVVPNIVVTELEVAVPEMVGTRTTAEDVERAIGAAFAIGTVDEYLSSSSSSKKKKVWLN
ncbi:hypothetical protein V8E53_005787 [Lactarius tabidus]